MPDGCVAHGALDAGRSRERRVHKHDCWLDRRVEIIVDLLGIEPCDRRVGKQCRQQGVARFGKLVQYKRSA